VVWVHDLVTVEVVQGRPQRLRGILVDITARKQLEAQLQQAQKMEAIGRLAGGLAHDFNNLLTVINGHAELLLAAHPPSTSLHDSAAAIAEAGQRAAWLTEQLLAFSRQTVTAPQVLDLNEVIRQTERLLRRLIGEAIELSLDLQEPLPAVRLDPGRVSQVLINLAINARDAMPRGGSLTIATRTVQRASPREPDLSPASWVVLTVRDTGHGMPPEVKARIFEPFFTTKPAGSGTGLGLAVVYGIVQQAGGWIDVESEPGQGACFHLHFPSLEETPQPPPAPPLPAPVRRGTETILVVEDESGVRGLVRTVLARQGYRVLVAESPAQALALLAEHGQPIDLLLTDLVMPGLSGRELAARLTAQQPGMKVLYMSGYTNDEALRRDLVHETVDFLAKPFTPQALLDKVQAILARGTGSQAMP
jgi:nitrogen-specific signal transduction histidine kinase/CheY-like chemotaxis protein